MKLKSIREMNFSYLKTHKGIILKDLIIFEPNVIEDDRGYFMESWNQKKFNDITGKNINFCQDNHSRSIQGVLRGLHYQLNPCPQEKLVRCTKGCIFDVVVDIRRYSPTYGDWGGIKLSEKNNKQLWIPKGFAHGFLTLSEIAEVQYKTNSFWNKKYERSIIWDDENLKIDWFMETNLKEPILSDKDASAPNFKQAEKRGDIF
tara:strand:- start:275 stop:883 length:609 start_codon:yes stop_codon:yes gene_type:complete